MKNIVVTNDQGFTPQQRERLDGLGNVTFYDSTPQDAAEYVQRVEGADIICSGAAGLQDAYASLKDVYVTVGFVSVAFVDVHVLTKNNVRISNAPGSNRHAVAEWVMAMMIALTRDLPRAINTTQTYRVDGSLPPLLPGLAGNRLTILGNGHVASRVSGLATAFGMEVEHFHRGGDLHQSVSDADVVVDALSSNPSTDKLLDAAFFAAMKRGAHFVTVTRAEVVDENAMIASLDSGHLAGVATDCGGILVGDAENPYYRRLAEHPKVLATPHIAYNSVMSGRTGAEVMIDNVEAYINGKPQNLLN